MEDEIREVLQFWSCKTLGDSIPECNFENVIESIMTIIKMYDADKIREQKQENYDFPKCTRPDSVGCHAGGGPDGYCMNAFQCPPIDKEKE